MPIPANQITTAEIVVGGEIVAGGGQTKLTSYTFHYKRTTTAGTLSKTALDTFFQSTVMDKVLLAVNVRWKQLHNIVRWVDDAVDPGLLISHVNLGAVATPGGNSFDTVMLLLRSAYRGRAWQGRKFFAGLSEADTTQPNDDILNAGAITKWNDVITGLMTPLVDGQGNTWKLQVLSRSGSQLRVNPTTVVTAEIVQTTLNKTVRSMKRRKVASQY